MSLYNMITVFSRLQYKYYCSFLSLLRQSSLIIETVSTPELSKSSFTAEAVYFQLQLKINLFKIRKMIVKDSFDD